MTAGGRARPSRRVGKLGVAAFSMLGMIGVLLAVSSIWEAGHAPQATPEAAYHSFYVAVVAGDEPALRRLTLPLPPEEFAWLLKGQHLTQNAAEGFHDIVMNKRALRRLKAGDELTMPGGKVVAIRPGQVGDDRAVLVPEGSPIPTDVRRVGGVWKVDARPLVAGRKAADAALRDEEAGRKSRH